MCADVCRRTSVAFVPYWGAGNPYQDALAGQLSALGVEVDTGRSLKGLFRYGVVLNGRPDVVHVHWLPVFGWRGRQCFWCLAFVVRLVLLRIHGVPLVWTIHNLLPHESIYPRCDWLLARIVAALANELIVHGPSAKQRVIQTWRLRDPNRVTVIPHGSYMGDYPNHIGRAAARRKLALDDSRLMFLFLGAIRPYKGVLELIGAFQRVATDHAMLFIAGQPLNDEFARAIETASAGTDHIYFRPGFVPDDEIQVYMNAADVVVLPYRRVLSSGAALLAMAFGKPCIAPTMGSLADVLDESGAFLYDPESQTGLLEGIREAIERADALPQMGEHNRRKAAQWTWEKAAEATKALYDRCLSGGRLFRFRTVR